MPLGLPYGGGRNRPFDARRALAMSLMRQGGARPPQNLGQGIASAGQQILGALMAKRADEAESRNRAQIGDIFTQNAGDPDALSRALLGAGGNPQAFDLGTALRLQQMQPEKFKFNPDLRAPSGMPIMTSDRGTVRPIEGATFAPDYEYKGGFRIDERTGEVEPVPEMQKFMLDRAAAGRPSQSTTVISKEETAEAKKVGEGAGTMFNEIQGKAMEAGDMLFAVRGIDKVLEGVETGTGTATKTQLLKLGRTLGLDIGDTEEISRVEAAQALNAQLALQVRSPDGPFGGLTGATSDRDLAFLQSIPPSISQTPEGRKLVTKAWERGLERRREVSKLATKYRRENGTFDAGFWATPEVQDLQETEMFTARDWDALSGDTSSNVLDTDEEELLRRYGIER